MTKTTTKQNFLRAYESYLKRAHYSKSEIKAALRQLAVPLLLIEEGLSEKWYWPNANTWVVKHNNGLKVSGSFAREL